MAAPSSTPNPRPMLTRQQSDSLFDSYYESALADQPSHLPAIPVAAPVVGTTNTASKPLPRRVPSTSSSSSSSDYSTEDSFSDYSSRDPDSPPTDPPAFRRPAHPAAAHTRRTPAAVSDSHVHHKPASKSSPPSAVSGKPLSSSTTHSSRRGLDPSLKSLVFASPSDAHSGRSRSSHPPSTAPPGGVIPPEYIDDPHTPTKPRSHHRSASDAVVAKSAASRNVGIVGTSAPIILEPLTEKSSPTVISPPIFIHPQSRSPSPASPYPMTPSSDERPGDHLFKQVAEQSNTPAPNHHQSNPSPSIAPSESASRTSTSHKPAPVSPHIAAKPFLHYQPGQCKLFLVLPSIY
jgi:hypothetical protein